MGKLRYPVLLVSALCFSACTLFLPSPAVNLQAGFDGKDIAVLDFSAKGMKFTQRHGAMASDCLTTSLLLSNKFSLIERARVKEAEKVVGITSATPISIDQMQRMGLRLKARFIIVGDLYAYSQGGDFSDDAAQTATLSFRILNTATGEVAGVVSHTVSFSDTPPEEIVEKLVRQIADKLAAQVK